jgi:inner membrane protein
VIWAIRPRLAARSLWPALIASMAIDIDHIPGRLGADWLTAGTPRPYTHSLAVVSALLLGAALWRRRRPELLGVASGVAIHLGRDLAEGGVPLLWPLSRTGVAVPQGSYLAAMALVIAVGAYRARRMPLMGEPRPSAR